MEFSWVINHLKMKLVIIFPNVSTFTNWSDDWRRVFFFIYNGQCPEASHTFSLLLNFVSFCHRGSDVGRAASKFPYKWVTSTVDSSVTHNKSCGDWDSSEYVDIISTLSLVLPQEIFTVNDRLSASLIDWTTLCSVKSRTFFSLNRHDCQGVYSNGNSILHEQRYSLTVTWSRSNNSWYMVW